MHNLGVLILDVWCTIDTGHTKIWWDSSFQELGCTEPPEETRPTLFRLDWRAVKYVGGSSSHRRSPRRNVSPVGTPTPPELYSHPIWPQRRPERLLHRFVQARRLAKDDPDGMASMCLQLLANDDLETAMRAGDVFAALVDHFFEKGDWQQCYSLIGRWRNPPDANVAILGEVSSFSARTSECVSSSA